MELIIGRDESTSQLRLTSESTYKLYGNKGSVPQSVSRQHCSLTVLSDGKYLLKNLKSTNTTYVNGVAVETKTVTDNDNIELGPGHYPLRWEVVKVLLPQVSDVRHLEKVWHDYDSKKTALQVADRRFNAIRNLTGLITMVAILLMMFSGQRGWLYFTLYGLAIALSLVFFIKSWLDASKVPAKHKKLDSDFHHNYVCPHCHHFLGNTSYDLLMQNDACPYCKTKFAK